MKTLSEIKLHIVAFDVPDPPDYGGAIDVYYKVKNLADAGVKIFLHCPVYGGRTHSDFLDGICEKVFYYKRYTGLKGLSFRLPYMVYSRRNKDLLKNLKAIDAPILFDGASTAYYLSHPDLKNRIKILRPQNVEQDYYRLLAKREKQFYKKLYYFIESGLLKNFENTLGATEAFFTVAGHDHDFFKKQYPNVIHEYIPSFQPYDSVNSKTGKGKYCLYHGNLSLAENEEAAIFLLREVVPHCNYPFIISGRNPGKKLMELAETLTNCKIIPNPSMKEMENLIVNAQIHVLPTFQNTGLKLKLLHALFNGRHVIVNKEMIEGTGLGEVCHIANNKQELINKILALKDVVFEKDAVKKRNEYLSKYYNSKTNAQRIITYLQQKSL